jgi:hypothetical protein
LHNRSNFVGRAVRLSLVAWLAVNGCSAVAQGRETWRCTASNGSYQVNNPPMWDKTTVISGRINFHSADFAEGFSSFAKIGFSDSKFQTQDDHCHCNGLFVKAWPNPDRLAFYILTDGEVERFDIVRKIDTPITFKISIDAQGLMTVQVGKEHLETKTAVLRHPQRDTLLMFCTGADVSFLNVNPQ